MRLAIQCTRGDTYQVSASMTAHARSTQLVTIEIPHHHLAARELWGLLSKVTAQTGRTNPRIAYDKAEAPLTVWMETLRTATHPQATRPVDLLLTLLEAQLGPSPQPETGATQIEM